jgi:Mrp family chromosome partitioning ATPase
MSTLDEAFIKAYRKGQAAKPSYAPEVGSQPPNRRATDAAAHAAMPSPHARFGASSAVRSAPMPQPAPPVASPEQFRSAAESPSALRPVFEVRHFVWPRLVGSLVAQAHTELQATIGLLAARSQQGRRSLLVTGCARGEGRTTLLLTLAHVAGLRGLRAVLVDLDFRHPDLAAQLGLAPEIGGEEILQRAIPLAEVLIESPGEGLTLLPLVRATGEPVAVESQRRLCMALAELRNHFDLVLVDSGPLDSDAAAIDLALLLGDAPIDDVLVVRTHETQDAELRAVGKRLLAARLRRWDLAENFARIPA